MLTKQDDDSNFKEEVINVYYVQRQNKEVTGYFQDFHAS